MRRSVLIAGVLVLLGMTFAAQTPLQACAGYTLTVASDGSPQQELLTQIMAELIRQRTGTRIELRRFATAAELQAAARRQEVDLLIADLPVEGDAGQLYGAQVQLLKPFGLQQGRVMPAFQSATLQRFPALRRLLNRLAGSIDDATMQRLEQQLTPATNLRLAARQFLRRQHLIFGS